MDRIRRLSQLLLEKYPNSFTADFERNKEVLEQVAVITSKNLRNQIAGYITKVMRQREAGKEIIEEAKTE